jgi:hypothetical protein
VPRGGVYIWIFAYRGVRVSGVPRRPIRIDLGEKQMHACGFGEGYMLYSRTTAWLLQVFVKFGPSTGKRTALAVLNSLRVTVSSSNEPACWPAARSGSLSRFGGKATRTQCRCPCRTRFQPCYSSGAGERKNSGH